MEIVVVGLNHKTAPVELRERLHFPEKDLPRSLELLGQYSAILERMIVSTCNRVEVYATVEDVKEGRASIVRFLSEYHRIDRAGFEGTLYLHASAGAVRHIFRVASSLDAMVIGEPQIVGQFKAAYQGALEQQATGAILNHLCERALYVAKRVRTETGVAQAACSVPSAAVELARKIFGDLSGRTAMILGAGEMAELAAKNLADEGVKNIIVSNRSFERAQELAGRLSGRAIRFDDAKREMVPADVVISSTGAPHYVLSKADLTEILHLRRNRPIFLIDIAVPRDIDPSVNDLDNVYLYDIDDLEGVVQANLRERQKEAERAEAIVEKEVAHFTAWLQSLEVVPTIVSLRRKLEAIREAELQKALNRLPRLTPEEREAIAALTASLVNKILHEPMTELKKLSTRRDGHWYATALRRLFSLDESSK